LGRVAGKGTGVAALGWGREADTNRAEFGRVWARGAGRGGGGAEIRGLGRESLGTPVS
jgi:hypothetical protein